MKIHAPKTIIVFLLALGMIQKISAQTITVDFDDMQENYEADFTKSFKIKFANATEKLTVVLKTGEVQPSILKEGADFSTFTIPFTVTAAGLATKDKSNKPVKITHDKFDIHLGDDIKFTVTKKTAAAATTATDIEVDISNPEKKYETSFKKDFTISFTGSEAKSQKVSITTGPGTTAKTTVIQSKVDLATYKMKFTSKSNKLHITDEKNKDFVVESSPFTVTVGTKKFTVASTGETRTAQGGDKPEAEENSSESKTDKIPYWSYIRDNNLGFSLQGQMLVPSASANCCDSCEDCDDNAFVSNNRIIYDGRSGVTYFVKADSKMQRRLCGEEKENEGKAKNFRVDHANRIRLKAGDPLVYIVENVNPALYKIELSDSAFSTNAETTGLLEALLLEKSEGRPKGLTDETGAQVGEDEREKNEADQNEYLKIKTGLIIVKSEMIRLLDNLRRSSPYLHNCVQAKKREALVKINAYPSQLKKYDSNETYKDYSLLALVDVFLNQETEDSTLNHQIKVLYGEFVAASYKIAYRYPEMPEMDRLIFKLSITAKPDSPYPSLLNVQMEHPTQTVQIKRFFKIDVSSGLYLGFRRNQSYVLQPDTLTVRNVANTDDSLTNIKRVVREDDGKREIGFASFLHLYFKYSNWFNIAGTVGAGISFDEPIRPRYFTGVSLLFGSHNRLCITGGLVWGKYDDLSNRYKKTGDRYDALKDTETSINYAARFKSAGFIAVSYNLPFLKRKSKQGDAEAKPKDNTDTKNKESGGDKKDQEGKEN